MEIDIVQDFHLVGFWSFLFSVFMFVFMFRNGDKAESGRRDRMIGEKGGRKDEREGGR